MFCNNCGEKLAEGTTKCHKCGTVVITKADVENVVQAEKMAAAGTEMSLDMLADGANGGCGCLMACLLFLNPLYWKGKACLRQAKTLAHEGNAELAKMQMKKGRKLMLFALGTSLLAIIGIVALIVCCSR